ncbi:MAG: AAA family ATPase [Alphaproteobacteria bacterium]|nr:AAA family ATPase [Alphaproteobacteria bacterium]
MTNLFDAAGLSEASPRPLADRLRPQSLADVVGQEHLTGTDGAIGRFAATGRVNSIILWGPPGTGKTTLARLLSGVGGFAFDQLSAIFSGVNDLKQTFAVARARRETGQGTLLFVDEIHRFNRAQQDAFLPVMEDGTIVLVGATTENPSFALNGALLSRAQVLVLRRLDSAALDALLVRAEKALGRALPVTPEAREQLLNFADGDGRQLLTLAEDVFALPEDAMIDSAALMRLLQRRAPLYDKSREEHFNLISALHKSVRGSDPDAALYWLARMLSGGEDPRYLARRLVRMAIEDVGLADPNALQQALAARDAYDFLGSPEGELALAQATVYLATAPKSTAAYAAFNAATAAARSSGSLMPPLHIVNAPTRLMKDLGYGAGYVYDPDTEEGFSGQSYFPDAMERRTFYQPRGEGFEETIRERLEHWADLRAKLKR